MPCFSEPADDMCIDSPTPLASQDLLLNLMKLSDQSFHKSILNTLPIAQAQFLKRRDFTLWYHTAIIKYNFAADARSNRIIDGIYNYRSLRLMQTNPRDKELCRKRGLPRLTAASLYFISWCRISDVSYEIQRSDVILTSRVSFFSLWARLNFPAPLRIERTL